ncbi:DUF1269 domain-containing protein [Actinomyces glycerinitolerans]|uniref:DUF1269 domain-containing protein n=1 Tax=Actinomyces glycerinitolerans TaxID=1892869 RepID=A0A1M4RYJ2_9ACTO|nr:DUF1269 domain-containing protein [Actinomyces glycerinitolerans]SHE25001.1 Hypothetical protein ACGLYG10_1213 [Actinomyces glycerinitolerans]
MTDHNFAAITFAESSKAYEALSDLRQASAEGRIAVPSAVILEREPDGRLHVAEGDDAIIGAGAGTGGLVGMFVGILGGPLGILLGWGAGALVGSIADVKRADRSQTIIGDFSSRLPAGTTAIFAEVEEVTPEVLDGLAAAQGGTVLRRPAIEVLAELEAAEEAAKAADREASRVMREERRQERKEAWDERVARLKARFQRQS